MLGVYVFMLQGFRGLHRSWFNESKAFASWCNRTISSQGLWRDREVGLAPPHTHTHTHTHRYTDVWRHKHADTGFFYSIKKVLFIYTHFLHSEPQDVKQPFETLCEVPIDPH